MPSGLSPGAVDAEGGVKLSSVSVAVPTPANDAKGAPDVKVKIAGDDDLTDAGGKSKDGAPDIITRGETSTGAPIARFPEKKNAR